MEELLQEYSEDYFDTETLELLKSCKKLLDMVRTGQFEYDTFKGDTTLQQIKFWANKVDI